jgi:predicted MPP superfamily phosphohydrolase
MQKQKLKRRKIVALSDLHFGHCAGLLPMGFINSDGAEVIQNVGQKYLWECFLDLTQRVKIFKPDYVLIVGDVVEGTQRKQGGVGLTLRPMQDQKAAAVQALKLLKKASYGVPFLFVQGTEYHVGTNGEAEEDIAGMLDAKPYDSLGPGRLVREFIKMDMDGVIIQASHGISGSTVYRASPVDRELQRAKLNADQKLDLQIHAHVHNYILVDKPDSTGLTLPCWQLQTTYARKKSNYSLIPDIGGVFITVDPEAKSQGLPCVDVQKQLYKLPPIPTVKL